MGSQEHFEKKESGVEKGATSQLEEAIKRGEELVTRFEHQKNQTVRDVESIPQVVDRTSFNKKLSIMDRIKQEAKNATLAASFLASVHGNAFAESVPKDQDSAPQTQEQLETIPAPSITVEETNMTLEIIKGVANMALEQKKKDVSEVLQGVDSKGNEVSVKDRIEKASGVIPSQIPKLGNIASVLSMVIDIQREISEAKPGYEKNIASRVARLLVDIPTQGLASFAWEILSKNQQNIDITTESVTSERN